jgi:hypothetical protein
VELLGLPVTVQKNGQLRGCCPLCGSDNPRNFVVSPSTLTKGPNLFQCWKCKKGGDQLVLTAEMKNLKVHQAADWLMGVGGTVDQPKRSFIARIIRSRLIRPLA